MMVVHRIAVVGIVSLLVLTSLPFRASASISPSDLAGTWTGEQASDLTSPAEK